MVNIYKFHKKGILIQPPGESREQHLGDVRQKKFELHKISLKTKYWKGRYILAHFLGLQLHLAYIKISQLETLKLLEVLVLDCMKYYITFWLFIQFDFVNQTILSNLSFRI